MIEAIAELVGDHPLFRGLPADVAELVAGCARNEAFATDELLIAEGAPAEKFHLLRRGRVALEIRKPGSGQLVVETLGPDELLGLSWLFGSKRWHTDARALEPVGTVAVDAECLLRKAEADPVFGYALMKRVAPVMLSRLQATRLRLLDLYGHGADNS
jgi:CRP-like cAMP-binding protein